MSPQLIQDNYQCHHKQSIQVDPNSGIIQKGMVFSISPYKEFNKPVGSKYRDPFGQICKVIESELMDYWTSRVVFKGSWAGQSQQRTIKLPKIGWSAVTLVGLSSIPNITYLN